MKRSVKELAGAIGASVEGDENAGVAGVAGPERAGAKDLIYVEAAKHVGTSCGLGRAVRDRGGRRCAAREDSVALRAAQGCFCKSGGDLVGTGSRGERDSSDGNRSAACAVGSGCKRGSHTP